MGMLLAACIGLVAGITLQNIFHFGFLFVIVPLVFTFTAFLVSKYYAKKIFILCAIAFTFMSAGFIQTERTARTIPAPFGTDIGSRVSYAGIALSDPDTRETGVQIPVAVTENSHTIHILVRVTRADDITAGDKVVITGTLSKPEPFDEANGRIFHYDTYLSAHGIALILDYGSIRKVGPPAVISPRAFFGRTKNIFIKGIQRALPEPYAALASGITIGGKSGLGTALQDDFTRAGLVQIIVLSGYNIMIIAEWILSLAKIVHLRKRVAGLFSLIAIAIFIGITGVTATALRAALMAGIAIFARITGRTYDATRALLVAIILMLLVNPLYLTGDPGFSLSIIATLGLIFLSPFIERRLSWITVPAIRVAVSTTLAAQIAILPLLLFQTGNLSIVSIPANVAVMPFVPLAMAFALLAGVAGIIFGSWLLPVAIVLGFPAYLATHLIISIATISAKLPLAAFSLPPIPFVFVIFIYALLVAAIYRRRKLLKKYAYAP